MTRQHTKPPRAPLGWLTPHLAVTVGTLSVSVVLAYSGLKSDARNLQTLVEAHARELDDHERQIAAARAQSAADRELLLELKGDVKLIRAMLEQQQAAANSRKDAQRP